MRLGGSGIHLNVLVSCKSRVLGGTRDFIFWFVLSFTSISIGGFSLSVALYPFGVWAWWICFF